MGTRSLTPPTDGVAVVLARHAVRRSAGVPTISVLVGPVGVARRAWQTWGTSAGHPQAVGSVADPRGMAELVIRAVSRGRDLLADACGFVATRTARPADEFRAALAAMTRRDLGDFFAAHDGRLPVGPTTRLAREILEQTVSRRTPDVRHLQCGTDDPLPALGGFAGLIPTHALPAVFLAPPSSAGIRDWFRSACAATVEVVTRLPALPVAIAIPTDVWAEYARTAPESRVKALLREGVVELPVLDERGVEQLLRGAGVDPPVVPPAIRAVVASTVPVEFAHATAGAITAPVGATTPAEDDRARSAAERFLFEFLELLPDTAGRFELNAGAGFRFGSREAEIDLIARDLHIAIEIDGYYHFRDPDAYRRDREKDWELQRHGFLVLRFLADDIIPRLEDVRDRILTAVGQRRAARGDSA